MNLLDLALMQEGLEFVLRVGKTAPLIDIVDSRVLPAPDADSEAELIRCISSLKHLLPPDRFFAVTLGERVA